MTFWMSYITTIQSMIRRIALNRPNVTTDKPHFTSTYLQTWEGLYWLDFFIAFDTIEHPFIFYCLEHFESGRYFSNKMKTLYVGGNSSVKLSQGTSQTFYLKRGVRQCCPVSVYLFLIAAQMFIYFIKQVSKKEFKLKGEVSW